MSLPGGDQYQIAIQNPRTAFSDTGLKNCKVENTQLGLPKPYSGGFTTTYHLFNSTNHYAVRCFTKEIPSLEERYLAIGNFLQRSTNGYFVETACLKSGININGNWHPIIKMLWLDGEPLNIFVEKNLSRPGVIKNLLMSFTEMVSYLEKIGVAHGDLQHGNIIVKEEKLYLIDYDGIFLPDLKHLKTNEIGHINYQHPLRDSSHFDPQIDRFSSIVIYVGLLVTSEIPTLWRKYDNSENILFRRDDFLDVDNSPLLSELYTIPRLTQAIDKFKGVCRLPFDDVPKLEEFVTGKFIYPRESPKRPPGIRKAPPRAQYLIIDASQINELLKHIGKRIEAVGYISDCYSGKTKYRWQPYVFLNFGKYPHQTFTLVLWSTSLRAFTSAGMKPGSYVGRWAKIVGVISIYHNRPQMEIEMPSQIQIIAREEEAKRLLHGYETSATQEQPLKQRNFRQDESIFNDLYKNKLPRQPSTTYSSPNASQTRTKPGVSPSTQPQAPVKKGFSQTHGIVGSIILGAIGGYFIGVPGLILGLLIGYQVSKRL